MTDPAEPIAQAEPIVPGEPVPPADDPAGPAGWTSYLDALTEAAHAVLDGPAGTADGPPPQFPVLEQPHTPLPAALEGRRDDVRRLLDRTTRELERRQSAVAEELAGLRPRTPRSPYRTEAGDAVDVVG